MKGEKILHSNCESKAMKLVAEVHLTATCKYKGKYFILNHTYCTLQRASENTGMCQIHATQHNIFDTHL